MTNLFYIEDHSQYDNYWPKLKRVSCPHCHAVGFLNRHGFLRGYGEDPSEKIQRGWRVYCSKRQQRGGCGRTHALLLAHLLRRRTITTSMVWTFFQGLLSGLSLASSWLAVTGGTSRECAYLLWDSWKHAQGWIRTWLCRISPPEASTQPNALLQALEHLQAVFPTHHNPIEAFQIWFQQPFFPIQ